MYILMSFMFIRMQITPLRTQYVRFTFLRQYYQKLLLECTFNSSLIFFYKEVFFFFFFWCGPSLKPLLNLLQFSFYFVFAFFFFLVHKPGGTLSFPARDWTGTPLYWKGKFQPLVCQETSGLVFALQMVGGGIQSPWNLSWSISHPGFPSH